jgi:DNA processing protein
MLRRGELERLGLDRRTADAVLDPGLARRAQEERDRARASGTRIIPIGDREYPALLMETVDPPLVLFVRGRFWTPERPHIAIVGARAASPYGLRQAHMLAAGLSERGAIVVSGLARGIDTAAHEGALDSAPEARAATAAVLGTGVDVFYPPENHSLGEAIAGRGALVSEFPLGTPPLPDHFPRRNRIIAGLAWGTIVVEAREKSGSLITARLAGDANREVFAVPGPVDLEQSRGTHRLIRDGACLVTSVDDVIAEFGPDVRNALAEDAAPPATANESGAGTSLSDSERVVLEALTTWEPTPIDRLIDGLNLSIDKVYAALTQLELGGLIDMLPGDRYVRRAKGRS